MDYVWVEGLCRSSHLVNQSLLIVNRDCGRPLGREGSLGTLHMWSERGEATAVRSAHSVGTVGCWDT